MKLVAVFLTLLFSMSSIAQGISSADAKRYAELLYQNDILTKEGKDLLLKKIEERSIEVEYSSGVKPVIHTSSKLYKATILQFCGYAFSAAFAARISQGSKIEDEIKNKEPLIRTRWTMYPGLGGGAREYSNSLSNNRSTIGFTRTKTLNDLHAIGLISDTIYNECSHVLKDQLVFDETELLDYMVQRSTHYTFYALNKKEQEEYIEGLTRIGILSSAGRDSLIQSYKPYELKTIPEILRYSSRYLLVDLLSYEPDPSITYPVIFEAIKKLLPGFHYTDLKSKILEQKETDLIRQDIQLSFTVDGSNYTHRFFHNYRREKPAEHDPELPLPRVDQDFQKGVNKWLTDIASPFRLYTFNIPDRDEGAYGSRRVGLIILKQGEAEAVTANVYQLSQESFDTRLSKANINKLLKSFEEEGFFIHLYQKEIDSAKEKIASSGIGSLEELLMQFPKTIVFFDWESGNLENPYEELTRKFADASRGAFTPTSIVDEYRKGWEKAKEIKYGFTFNGHRYETALKFETDWLDPAFMELIEKAMKENKVDGRIYYCVDDGQASGYIFLSSKQYEFMKSAYPDLLKDH